MPYGKQIHHIHKKKKRKPTSTFIAHHTIFAMFVTEGKTTYNIRKFYTSLYAHVMCNVT